MLISLITLLFLLFSNAFLSAQIFPQDTSGIDSSEIFVDDLQKPLGDTTRIYYYQLTGSETLQELDSSLHNFAYPANPIWSKETYESLQLLGSPLFQTYYSSKSKIGFRIGEDAYKAYRLQSSQIPYYEIRKKIPFTNLFYSQIGQKNTIVRAEFAHQVGPQFYYGLHYDMINYNGYFEHQLARHQNIGLTFRYRSRLGKYQAYFTAIQHSFNLENNGGLTSSSTSLSGIASPFLLNLATYSSTAKTENRHSELTYRQFFSPSSKDSSKQAKAASVVWGHRISFQYNRYKYFDTSPSTDSSYYGIFQVNNRGIRRYILHNYLDNTFSYKQALGGDFQNSPLLLKANIGYQYNWLQYAPEVSNFHNAHADLSIQTNPYQKRAFSFQLDGKSFFSTDGLDFLLKAYAHLSFGKWGQLEGNAVFRNYEPSLIEKKLNISQSNFWDNSNFSKSQDFSFGGAYAIPTIGFRFSAQNHSLHNFVYQDSLAIPSQFSGTINILQLQLQENFTFWKIHSKNQLSWQRVLAGNPYFRLPAFIFKHELYFEDYVFNTTLLRIGALLRYQTDYFANKYWGLTGQFYIQDNALLHFYPIVDFSISFKIWQFRCFATLENLLPLITQTHYFKAPNYAMPNTFLRLGISWRLFD